MRNLLAFLLFVPGLCIAQSVTLPYNPDANADSAIGAPDLLEFLPHFGGYFTPEPILVDGQTLEQYIENLESALAESESDTVALPMLPGTEPGQMLYWDGSQWTLVPAGSAGEFLGIDGTAPSWQPLPLDGTLLEVGCADQTACNYDPDATVNYAALCIYEDECGVCDGPGAIYQCGCADLPEGDCDCDGNQLDALNVCGGTCAADLDGDGICDDGDDCIGQADECGVCNGPGAIYECGCTGIAPDECDCYGTPDVDQDGICDTEDPCIGVADSDGDGICDDVDDCDGSLDLCGVCNGPGPIYACGCTDILDGECDCNGTTPNVDGDCFTGLIDLNGDGIFDSIADPCLGLESLHFFGYEYPLVAHGQKCFFQENLKSTHYNQGANVPVLDASSWGNSSAYCAMQVGNNGQSALYSGLCIKTDSICPTGWTSRASLTEYSTGYFLMPEEGGKFKEAGTSSWSPPNTGATNSTGLTFLPEGEVDLTGNQTSIGTKAFVWNRWSENDPFTSSDDELRIIGLYHDNANLVVASGYLGRGASVRCRKLPDILGCNQPGYMEYMPEATLNDGSCLTAAITGCTDSTYMEFNPEANLDDGSCQTLPGCVAFNYQGHQYEVTSIGTQCWLAENLDVSHYQNGDAIPLITDPATWNDADINETGMSAYPYNDPDWFGAGRYYNHYAVIDSRGICPNGWHVPSNEEWLSMEFEIGLPFADAYNSSYVTRGFGLSTKLKSTSHGGNNSTGFTGIPTGIFYPAQNLEPGSTNYTYFWTSTLGSFQRGVLRTLVFSGPYEESLPFPALENGYPADWGMSVRCIKD